MAVQIDSVEFFGHEASSHQEALERPVDSRQEKTEPSSRKAVPNDSKPTHPALVQASVKRVYDLDDVHLAAHRIASYGTEANRALLSLYDKMLKMGADRYSVKPASMPEFLPLYENLPNFSDVLDEIQRSLALCIDTNDAMEIQPMLLVGPPGIGKTHFGQAISNLFGTGFHMIPMASTTAGFVLGGASSQWRGAKPGKVFDAFLDSHYANPVFLIDEIDKAGGGREYDPLGALYTLLESGTARSFVDEFAEVPIDATGAIWIATCNDEQAIPSPIRDRMNVFEVKEPTAEQAARIALMIYQQLRDSHAWGALFSPEPSQDVLGALSVISPREVRRVIMMGFGNAKLTKRSEIRVEDFPHKKSTKRGQMGFTTH